MSHQYNRSSVSQHSRSVSQFFNLDELTDSELLKQVNNLKYQIKVLKLENEVLEKTIMRYDPSLMQGIQQALDYAYKLQTCPNLTIQGSFVRSQSSKFGLDNSSRLLLTSPSKVSTKRVESSAKVSATVIFGSGPKVNVVERSELVSSEMETLISSLEKVRQKASKQHALLKAQLEEISVRVENIEKACELFNSEVIVKGWDKIARRIPAEIWVRFMIEWAKIADAHIGKLRLRTSTLNTQYSKLKAQIKMKSELSESLRPVDFEKLKIENSTSLETIDHKLQQLSELKKMTGDANLTLTIHKKAMMEQNSYLTGILKRIDQRKKQTVMIDKETEVISIQAESLAHKFDEVKKVRQAFVVPDVMDYVGVKAECTDLKHNIKMLENRLHIQNIALTSLNLKLRGISYK